MTKIPYHEIELLKESINGDSGAFELIVKKYQSYICAITYSATGDVEKSEELAHETFINAWQGLPQLKNLSKFNGWLKSIAANVIRQWLRTKKRDIISQSASIDQIEDVSSKDPEPVRIAIREEQREVVREALNQIPEKYREPLVLYYRQKQSISQVAQLLELSEDTVRTRLFRGRKYLREQVAAMVETTISETGPGKAFTTAVIGSIAALSLKTGAASAATIAAATAAGGGKVVRITAFFGSLTGKIISIAAAIIIGITLLLINLQENGSVTEPNLLVITNPRPDEASLIEEDSNTAIIAIAEQPEIINEIVPDVNQDVSDSNDVPIETTPLQLGYQFQPKGLVSGLITDIETGAPVIDAEITLSVEPMSKIFYTSTDEHGFYFFDNIEKPGKSKLRIESFEYVGHSQMLDETPVIQLKEGEKLVRHFELPKACQIDLIVSDANGVPIKGVESRLTLPSERTDFDQSYTKGNTNNDGYLHIGGIAPSKDNYLLIVMHRSKVDHRLADGKIEKTQKNDYAPSGQYIKLNNPDKIELVKVILEKGSEIKGYIEYANGIPGYDLKVSAEPSWWNISLLPNNFEVDEFGFFTLKNIIPREYSILVSMNKSDNSDHIFSMTKIFLPLPDNELFTINLPVNPMKPMFSMEGSIIYNGPTKYESVLLRVRDSKGKRVVDDITTLFKNPKDHLLKNLNPEKGTYSVKGNPFKIRKLEEGTYSLEVISSNMHKKIENIQVPGDFVEVEVASSSKPTIDILVLDAKTNQPVTNYKFRVKKIKQLTSLQPIQENQWFDVNNEKGESEIGLVGPGIYQIQVAADNYAPKWSEDINTEEFLNTTIKLEPGGAIKGTIVDEQGNLVTGATVIPFSKTHGTNYKNENIFVSDEGATQSINGQFILKDLPPGLEKIKITHPDYAYKIIKDIEVQAGQTTDSIEITMDQGTIIEGYVYDKDGNPEPGTVLLVKRQDLPYQSVLDMAQVGSIMTDSNGFFSISGVSGEQCIISRRDTELADGLGLIWRSVDFYDNDIIQIQFGGYPLLSGTLVADGKPLANQRIVIYSVEPELYTDCYCTTETDSKGNFTFRGLIPGKYELSYKLDKNWIIVTHINVLKENKDVDLGVISYNTNEKIYEN